MIYRLYPKQPSLASNIVLVCHFQSPNSRLLPLCPSAYTRSCATQRIKFRSSSPRYHSYSTQFWTGPSPASGVSSTRHCLLRLDRLQLSALPSEPSPSFTYEPLWDRRKHFGFDEAGLTTGRFENDRGTRQLTRLMQGFDAAASEPAETRIWETWR